MRIPAPQRVRRRNYIIVGLFKIAPPRAAPLNNGKLVHILLCTTCVNLLTLALLMALVLGADYHNLAVSFDDFALVAHRLN